MQVEPLSQQVSSLIAELRGFHGHRTVWIDRQGRLCHSEPEEELEQLGYVYVTTTMRPAADELDRAMARFARTPQTTEPPRLTRTDASLLQGPSGLVAAM